MGKLLMFPNRWKGKQPNSVESATVSNRATDPTCAPNGHGVVQQLFEATRTKAAHTLITRSAVLLKLLTLLVMGTCSGSVKTEYGAPPDQHSVGWHHVDDASHASSICQCNCGDVLIQN